MFLNNYRKLHMQMHPSIRFLNVANISLLVRTRSLTYSTNTANQSQTLELKVLATNSGLPTKSVKTILETGIVGEEVRVQGWVNGLRKLKATTFIDLNDGSTWNTIPIVFESRYKLPNLTLHSSVDISGQLKENPRNPEILELHPISPPTLLGTCDQQVYPLAGKKTYDQDHIRKYLHLRFKTSKFSSLLRTRSLLSKSISDYFFTNGFCEIHTPILTGNDCEGAGETFIVRPNNPRFLSPDVPADQGFFNKKTFLSVSGQLHLEAAVGNLKKVWTMSPVFRAENQYSTRHLSEFYMIEAEMSFCYQIEQLLEVMESLVKSCIRDVVFENSTEWEYGASTTENEDFIQLKDLLETILKTPFTVMSFDEATNLLQTKLGSIVPKGEGLNREQELNLVEKLNANIPIFVINWPKEIKPFYMRETGENSGLVSAVDLLVPRIGELCGGSLRESNPEILESRLREFDPSGNLSESLSWYLELRKFGGTPTGGFGLGFDRLLQLVMGKKNIKDVNPFPRWSKSCPM